MKKIHGGDFQAVEILADCYAMTAQMILNLIPLADRPGIEIIIGHLRQVVIVIAKTEVTEEEV